MQINLTRIAHGKNSTLGYLKINTDFLAFTLEDEYREVKVKHKTRIPAGRYEIKFREVPSPMTQKYRQRFDWFNWHLELQNVPNFTNVYIHIGNDHEDSSGCILVGSQAYAEGSDYLIGNSTGAFRALYAKVSRVLNAGEPVFIDIQ